MHALLCFFFQAEDGIRDGTVTGVQTCALPISGIGDTAGARREYRTADSLFPGDRYLNGANAIFLIGIGDTAAAVTLIDRARQSTAGERMTLRAKFLLELTRGRRAQAAAIADSASRRFAGEQRWYSQFRQ